MQGWGLDWLTRGSARVRFRRPVHNGDRLVVSRGPVLRDVEGLSATVTVAQAADGEVALEGVLPISRFSYLDTDILFPGTMVELIEMGPEMKELFGMVRATAAEWDGKDPVRRM